MFKKFFNFLFIQNFLEDLKNLNILQKLPDIVIYFQLGQVADSFIIEYTTVIWYADTEYENEN